MIAEWTPEAIAGLRRLKDFVASTPRGKPKMRVGEVMAAVAGLPATWATHAVFRTVGSVELRRLVTDHGSVVVFSHEDDPGRAEGLLLVRWVAQGNRQRREPPVRSVRPATRMPRAEPPE